MYWDWDLKYTFDKSPLFTRGERGSGHQRLQLQVDSAEGFPTLLVKRVAPGVSAALTGARTENQFRHILDSTMELPSLIERTLSDVTS